MCARFSGGPADCPASESVFSGERIAAIDCGGEILAVKVHKDLAMPLLLSV